MPRVAAALANKAGHPERKLLDQHRGQMSFAWRALPLPAGLDLPGQSGLPAYKAAGGIVLDPNAKMPRSNWEWSIWKLASSPEFIWPKAVSCMTSVTSEIFGRVVRKVPEGLISDIGHVYGWKYIKYIDRTNSATRKSSFQINRML